MLTDGKAIITVNVINITGEVLMKKYLGKQFYFDGDWQTPNGTYRVYYVDSFGFPSCEKLNEHDNTWNDYGSFFPNVVQNAIKNGEVA